MKKIIISVLMTAVFGLNIFAQIKTVDEIINPEYVNELKEKGNVIIIHEKKNNVAVNVPECVYADQIRNNLLSQSPKGVGFLAEFMYLIPKAELTEDVEKVNVDSLAVIFRSVSKMEGMKYTHNGGKVETLYKKSYTIPSPDSFERIADPLEGPTDGLVSYSYQVDNTFGDTKYRLDYYQSENIVFSTFLNQIPMSKFGVKAVLPEHLRTNVMAIDLGDSIILYLCADVNAKNVMGVHAQIADSMTCRMEAIYRWFLTQYK